MLTERISPWFDRHLTQSQWTPEAKTLIEHYAPPDPERTRRAQEVALVAVHTGFGVLVLLLWAGAGALTSTGELMTLHNLVYRIGIGALCAIFVGMLFHLARFYDACVAVFRSRRHEWVSVISGRTSHRWPRSSSDLDFVMEVAIAAIVAAFV